MIKWTRDRGGTSPEWDEQILVYPRFYMGYHIFQKKGVTQNNCDLYPSIWKGQEKLVIL